MPPTAPSPLYPGERVGVRGSHPSTTLTPALSRPRERGRTIPHPLPICGKHTPPQPLPRSPAAGHAPYCPLSPVPGGEGWGEGVAPKHHPHPSPLPPAGEGAHYSATLFRMRQSPLLPNLSRCRAGPAAPSPLYPGERVGVRGSHPTTTLTPALSRTRERGQHYSAPPSVCGKPTPPQPSRGRACPLLPPLPCTRGRGLG